MTLASREVGPSYPYVNVPSRFVSISNRPSASNAPVTVFVLPSQELTFRDLAAPYVWRGGEIPQARFRHPVTLVTFFDACRYCDWLSTQLSLPIRLPTEAEWERAARGNLERARYPWGDDIDPSRANFMPDPGLKRYRGTRPVGSFSLECCHKNLPVASSKQSRQPKSTRPG